MLSKKILVLASCLLLAACTSSPVPQQQPANSQQVRQFFTQEANLSYQLLVAEFSVQNNQLNEAVKIYSQLNQELASPQIAERTYWLAQFNKQPEVALAAATKWAKLSPEDVDAQKSLAFMLLETQNFPQALQQLLVINELDKSANFTAYASFLGHSSEEELAAAYSQLAKQARSEKDLNKRTDLQVALAVLATYQGKIPLAESHLNQARQLNSPYLQNYLSHLLNIKAQVLYQQAMQAYEAEDLAAMEAKLKQILAFSPNNPTALNALGYTLVDKTQRLTEGFGYIKAALKQQPDSAAIQDSYGWALYKLNRPEEALVYLQQAYKQFPDDEIALHLYEVLLHLNQPQAAEEVLNQHPNLTK